MFKNIVLFLIAAVTSLSLSARTEYGTTADEKDLTQWLFEKAQKFSNLKAPDENQNLQNLKVFLLTDDELSKQICPDDPNNCHGLVGLFDTKTNFIYLREDINPNQDTISQSFLLHEMVHYLQFLNFGEDEMFKDCDHLYQTEKLAYESQDAFLKSEGQFFRAGGALRFFLCNN